MRTIKNNARVPYQKSHRTNKYNILLNNRIEKDFYLKKR